ncbi:hypothetical protein RNN91_01285 [Mycoplasmopsis felis]|uniref:hypothetical protein n=1 Tax=Mycoplasmopsis felis TaxID=33923 RepID=UPI002AF6CC05|nr:hypothetical protein [Mycoplasmopsis felis]WQQ01461.1 hypothetical protein RRG54_02630 [Mycoplasmopsis felis]
MTKANLIWTSSEFITSCFKLFKNSFFNSFVLAFWNAVFKFCFVDSFVNKLTTDSNAEILSSVWIEVDSVDDSRLLSAVTVPDTSTVVFGFSGSVCLQAIADIR